MAVDPARGRKKSKTEERLQKKTKGNREEEQTHNSSGRGDIL
jgi:hypothetical protein